ncbi:MAG: hypothetical protein M1818_002516 [Claussenomyces sp. TS43310]|nr:MAG: hypothetical protein M1818_002516 [Claussenomyces sp. TS43310]
MASALESRFDEEQEFSVQERIALAALEGHDADIPSNEGYVLSTTQDLKRLQSAASRRSHGQTAKGDEEKQMVQPAAVKGLDGQPVHLVGWDGEDDPKNPMNWSTSVKVMNIFLIAALAFIIPLASSMFAPGVPQLMAEFGSTSQTLSAFVVSAYVLGFAIGPLLLAPLSELYGRLIVYHITNVLFVVFTVACAVSSDLSMLIVFRFLAGCMGATPLTNGGGTIADMIAQSNRGLAMSCFSLGPLIGPVVGPLCGGFLSEAKGWRWVFWVITMVSGLLTILCLFFMRESYAPYLLKRKVARLRKETGNMELRSKLDIGLSPKDLFWISIARPIKMLIFSPIVFTLSLYMGISYAYMYILFTTFTLVFEGQYGFSDSLVGLAYLGLGIGNVIGLSLFSYFSDKTVASKAIIITKEDGTTMAYTKPEARLPPMTIGAILLPIGFFIYGWTAQYQVQYIVPIFGTLLIGGANICIFMITMTYLVDAYTVYAASALAANTVLRSVMAALLPLCGQKMYSALGLGWGNSLLAFVAMAMMPLPYLFSRYGEHLRNKFSMEGL